MARKRFNAEENDAFFYGANIQVRRGGRWQPATVTAAPARDRDGWESLSVRYNGPTTATITHGDPLDVGPGEARRYPENS